MDTLPTLPPSALITTRKTLSAETASAIKHTSHWVNSPYTTYSGADIVVQATLPGGDTGTTITLGELQTLSYSIHRENTPVRALGHVAPVGFVKGPRTIAGTMIWTVFDHYGWYRLSTLKNQITNANFPIADMLPPIDLTITFSNEFGRISSMRIMGVTFTDEGGTMSIDDLILESTVNYMARNIQPIVGWDSKQWPE